ncbi:MAG TPA: hypothetical protein VOA41_12450 [Candidatus Dormibacteraeota bacterium]|nr:hypothetical protein [Candidatus Dormibacteraeota bacterium]
MPRLNCSLNAFNHLVFRVGNGQNFTDFVSAPSRTTISVGDYNIWATANNQPVAPPNGTTPLRDQVIRMVDAQRNAKGVLPDDFYSISLPQNFWGKPPVSFDITTLDGYKLFRLRQSYNDNFGTLYQFAQSRYIQLGVKIFF